MNAKSTKIKITSLIFGVMGMIGIIICVISIDMLQVHEILFRIGAGLTCVLLAIEPDILFHQVYLTHKSLRSLPPITALSVALIVVILLCFLLAGITYLIS